MLETGLMVAGGVVGSLAGKLLEDEAAASVRNAVAAMRAQMSAHLPLPQNHDLVRGLRQAHLIALDRIAIRFEDALKALPAYEISENDRTFAKDLRAFLKQRRKPLSAPLSGGSPDFEVVDEDAIRHALDNLILPAPNEDRNAVEAQAAGRQAAEDAALAEIAAQVGAPPSLFLTAFRGELGRSKGGSWHDMMALHVNEMIKTEQRFRAIFVVSELVDIKRLIAASGDEIERLVAEGVRDIRGDIAAVRDEARGQHAEVMDNLAGLPKRTVQALQHEMVAGFLQKLEELGVLKGAVIEQAKRIAPSVQTAEQAVVELREAVDRLQRLQDQGRHTSNLGPSVDAILKRIADLPGRGEVDQEMGAGFLQKLEEFGVLKGALIEQAKRIAPSVQTAEQAVVELREAVDRLQRLQDQGRHTSNLGPSVDAILKRIADLSGRGEVDAASMEANRAISDWEQRREALKDELDQLEAEGSTFLQAGVDLDLLRRDQKAAAEKILRGLKLEHPNDPSALFQALRLVGDHYMVRGRDFGGLLDLEVSIALAELALGHAPDDEARGTALNDIGVSLNILGPRQAGAAGLATMQDAVDAFTRALETRTKDAMPVDWATTQNNLGNTLMNIGIRKSGEEAVDFLERSVQAYEHALEVHTKDAIPARWAMTQNNLGATLQEIGTRKSGEAAIPFLERSVQAYEHALEIRTKDAMPVDWATTQNNLGNTLQQIGIRKSGEGAVDILEGSFHAYERALEVHTKDAMPVDWAMTQNNLGNTLSQIGIRKSGKEAIPFLERSVQAYKRALEIQTKDAMPVDWAGTMTNLGLSLITLGARSDNPAPIQRGIATMDAAIEILRSSQPQERLNDILAIRQDAVDWLTERGFGLEAEDDAG
jgi:tetratricopeptide (TPR) repeat protein